MGTVKTIRIFVSSTFSDMGVERNALQAHVYPKLQDYCANKGMRFQAIDLRWGVSKEAGLNQRATNVCLKEIERCQRVTKRPNFLLLLGDRYGWQPLPYEIPADEWLILIARMNTEELSTLEDWYKPDNNSMPPVYVLQPRHGDCIDQDTWNAVEHQLHEILVQALSGLDWTYEKRLKYEASVTEQEIYKGIFQYPHRQEGAICFFRTIYGLPEDNETYQETTANAEKKQLELKQALIDLIPSQIQHYQARWTGESLSFDEQAFCSRVEAELKKAIDAELATFAEISPLDLADSQHIKFMLEHSQDFVGRDDVLETISNYLRSDNKSPLVLYGQSGIGKSTLMAKAIELAVQPIYRFIGISPEASNIRSLLATLCRAIGKRYGITDEIPEAYEDLVTAFQSFLTLASAEKPLLIFLDALDQLSSDNSPSDLVWLPSKMPANVKLVVSTIRGPYLDGLKRRLVPDCLIEIMPMARSDGANVLDKLLKHSNRTLTLEQRKQVLDNFEANGLPLYLRLAFEEAKLWHSYTPYSSLQPDVPSLLEGNLFKRLSDDAEHGAMLVSRSMAYIQVSRHGLSETELLEALTQDEEFWLDFETRSHKSQREALKHVKLLPIAVWSRLYFDLEPYLVERGLDGSILLTFYHRQFSEVVEAMYLTEGTKKHHHGQLAEYFRRQADPIGNSTWMSTDTRSLNELPYHLLQAQNWRVLENTLSDIVFIESKCRAQLLLELSDDYRSVSLASEPGYAINTIKMDAYAHFVRQQSHVLKDYPELTLQQAANYLEDEAIQKSAQAELEKPHQQRPWLQVKSHKAGAATPYISFHTERRPLAAALSYDGERIALCDGGVSVYEVYSGRRLFYLAYNSRLSHTVIAMSPDGRMLAIAEQSASGSVSCSLWDLDQHQKRAQILGYDGRILTLKFSFEGAFLAIGTALPEGGEIALWSVETESLLWIQKINAAIVRRIAFAFDEKTVLAGQGNGICSFWAVASGKQLKVINAHNGTINDLCISPSGEYIATVGKDGLCQIWSPQLKSGTQLQASFMQRLLGSKKSVTFSNHRAVPSSIVFLNDFQLLSGDTDGQCYVWNTSGELLDTFFSSEGSVVELAVSGNGRSLIALSAADQTCRFYGNLDLSKPSASIERQAKHLYFVEDSMELLVGRLEDKQSLTLEKNSIGWHSSQAIPQVEEASLIDWHSSQAIPQVEEAILMAVSRNQRFILTVARSGQWMLWDTKYAIHRLGMFTIPLNSAAIISVSNDGEWISAYFQENLERIFTDDLRSFKHRLPMMQAAIQQQDNGTVRFLGINTRLNQRSAEEIALLDLPLNGDANFWGRFDAESPRGSRGFRFSDFETFVRYAHTNEGQGIVDLWDFNGKLKGKRVFAGTVTIHDFSVDGHWLMISQPSSSMLHILDASLMEMPIAWTFPLFEAITSASMQTQGDLLALGYKQGSIEVLRKRL